MTEQILGPFRLTVSTGILPDGEVYDAWDTRVNRAVELVSVPRLSRRALDGALLYRGFFEEMEQHTLLRHPNVRAAVEHSPRESMDAWYVMEPSQGATLRNLLETIKRLPWMQAVAITHELAKGLAFAHGRGVVHGNIRPAHIYLLRRGRVILGGFDVALKTFIRTNVAAFEGLDEIVDNPIYVAPETLRLSEPGPRSDLFSLGVVAFEMLTGRPPFETAEAIRQYARSRRSVPPDPWDDASHLPEALRDLIVEMLAPTIDGRPLSVAEVLVRLKELLIAENVTDVPASLRSSFARQSGVFPRDDDERDESTVILAAVSGAKPRKTARRGPVRHEADDDQPKGSRKGKRRRTQKEFGKKTRDTERDRTALPDDDVREGPSRRRTNRYRSTSDEAGRHRPRRSIALEVLSNEGYLGNRPKKEKSLTIRMITAASVVMGLFLLFYVVFLGDPSGSISVSKTAAERGRTPIAPPQAVESSDQVDRVAEGRVAVASPLSNAQRTERTMIAKVKSRIKAENPAAAERIARDGLAASPRSKQLRYLLAEAQFIQGRYDEALEMFREGDRIGGDGVDGVLRAAELFERKRMYQRALTLNAGIKKSSKDSRAVAGMGRALVGLKKFRQAAAALREYVELEPTAVRELTLLAEIEAALGNRLAARGLYREVLRLKPDNDTVRNALARIEGTSLEATTVSGTGADTKVVKTSRDYELDGDLAFKRGKFRLAAQLFRRALETAKEPKARLIRNFAIALQRTGRTRDAAKAYSALTKLAPRDAEAYFQLGRLLLELKRPSTAKKAFERAAEIDSKRWQPHFELGRIALANRRWREAARRFRAVLKRHPRDAAAIHNLGKALMEAGDHETAATAFTALGRLRPRDPAPLLTAAGLFKIAQRPTAASAALAEACRRGATQACQPNP